MVEEAQSLLAWSLASFHTALLVTLLLAGLYATGAAGELLAGLDTVVGLGLYAYLWAVTWWTNRRWLEAVGLAPAELPSEPRMVVGVALRWGAVAGLLFLVGPLVVLAGLFVVDGGLGILPFVVLAGLVGTLLAAAVGAFVGGMLATLDLALVRGSTALVPATNPSTDTP